MYDNQILNVVKIVGQPQRSIFLCDASFCRVRAQYLSKPQQSAKKSVLPINSMRLGRNVRYLQSPDPSSVIDGHTMKLQKTILRNESDAPTIVHVFFFFFNRNRPISGNCSAWGVKLSCKRCSFDGSLNIPFRNTDVQRVSAIPQFFDEIIDIWYAAKR